MSQLSTPLIDVIALSQQHCQRAIAGDLKYATRENFVGRVIDGYCAQARDVILLTRGAAQQLCAVQNYLVQEHGLSLYILDAYRPLRAVRDFATWFQQPPADAHELARKQIHYPHYEKAQLAALGYVADTVSQHCFGATVDLILVDAHGVALEMGTCFDFFDERSHVTATAAQIGVVAVQNRQLLAAAMQRYAFEVHPQEYWHFEHAASNAPMPLDIVIDETLRDNI